MNAGFPLIALLAPVAAALAIALSRGRGACWLPLAAGPALALALGGVTEVVTYPWLLLGCSLGVDATGAVFLLFTSVVWGFALLFAAGYVHERRAGFFASMLLAMTGNFGLILAQDMPSFYLFFALMSFASYPLVIHRRDAAVRHAGKVYLVLVVMGEVLIFSGMVGLAHTAGETSFSRLGGDWLATPAAPLIMGALLLGFGIKAGALPLHVWLPLAHPAAPAPASAVLSGAMIKAGLLGWLRFLPLGEAALPGWGDALVVAGLAASLYAVLFGFFQRQPKTILAYSSISKMGLMTAVTGVALADPVAAPVAVAAVGFYALDHAISKGALFLGSSIHPGQVAGRARRALVVAGLAAPSLGLAGFALTGGALAKTVLKKPLTAYAGLVPPGGVSVLLTLASIGAVLLVARFLWVHLRQDAPHAPDRMAYWAFGLQAALVLTLPALYLAVGDGKTLAKALSPAALWGAAWPVLVVGAATWAIARRPRRALPLLPAGDLLVCYERLVRALGSTLRNGWFAARRVYPREALVRLRDGAVGSLHANTFLRVEGEMGRAGVFGLLFLGLLALFIVALLEIGLSR